MDSNNHPKHGLTDSLRCLNKMVTHILKQITHYSSNISQMGESRLIVYVDDIVLIENHEREIKQL